MLRRPFALALIILAIAPCTMPFAACDAAGSWTGRRTSAPDANFASGSLNDDGAVAIERSEYHLQARVAASTLDTALALPDESFLPDSVDEISPLLAHSLSTILRV